MVDPIVFLTWKCPRRVSGSRELKHIPVDIFDEIFSWLRPIHNPDMTPELYHRTMAILAPVCRYFTYYAIREESRLLDFDGQSTPNARTPTGTWCTGIMKRLEPMETFRKDVRDCAITNWTPLTHDPQGPILKTFLKLFPRVLPRLENLRSLRLCMTSISRALFDSIGKLQNLEELYIKGCYWQLEDPAFVAPQTLKDRPFPSLRQLLIAQCLATSMESPIAVSFSTLASTPTLRLVTLVDSWWIPIFLPHLPANLLSLCVNLSSHCIPQFIAYLHTCGSLNNLAILSLNHDTSYSAVGTTHTDHHHQLARWDAESFKLEQDDLPNLRAFSGPLWLASIFVQGRPVSRVQLGFYNLMEYHDPLPPEMYGFGAFETNLWPIGLNSWCDPRGDPGVDLEDLSEIGTDEMQAASIPIYLSILDLELDFAMYLPHISHLQLRLKVGPAEEEKFLVHFGDCLRGFRKLERLYIHLDISASSEHGLACELSPGDQYDLVKQWKALCVTLTTVVLGSRMVWHWRPSRSSSLAFDASRPSQGHGPKDLETTTKPHVNAMSFLHSLCHQWELEILSPRSLQKALEKKCQDPATTMPFVRDWEGKIGSILEGSAFISSILK